MYNPFDIIPKNIDKNLRDIVIALIIIQFVSFVIFFVYILMEFMKHRRENKIPKEEKELNENKKDKFRTCSESEIEPIKESLSELKDENILETEQSHIKED